MQRTGSRSLRLAVWLLWLTLSTSSCGGSHEETLGGVKVPIPGGMAKSQETGIELALPGFGGAQAAYRGKVEPDQVIAFYKKEMPARGWKPTLGLLSQGGMLSYVKESTTVVVIVGKTDSGTNMTIMAGGTQR